MAGNPARIIKYRFDQETINKINQSQWWLKDIKELTKNIDEFTQPLCLSAIEDIYNTYPESQDEASKQ